MSGEDAIPPARIMERRKSDIALLPDSDCSSDSELYEVSKLTEFKLMIINFNLAKLSY